MAGNFHAKLLSISSVLINFRFHRARVKGVTYELPLYWSTQISTTTGYGDMPYTKNLEVVALTMASIGGTIIVTYFGAKNAALLANAARRRYQFL